MSEDKLPEKGELVRLDVLRIERNKQKDCNCISPAYEADVKNRRINCTKCGAVVDPFDVVVNIGRRHEELNELHERRLEQKKEIDKYKPHLRTIKYLEQQERRQLTPYCPACSEPFRLSELTHWVAEKFAAARIAIRQEKQRDPSKGSET